MSVEIAAISILVVTYNHESYIRQALNALFRQVFAGSIELVIADDKSTDSTLAIIKEYEGRDCRFSFKYLDYSENLGITKNYMRAFKACSFEYVAVLEGDDYWVSPHKLRRQYEFLIEHWESDVCSVNYFVYDEARSHFEPRLPPSSGHRFITARELIADNVVGNFSTCMYRRDALSRLPDALFEIQSYDWIINVVLARTCVIGLLEEPMSVYRLHALGAWTQTPHIEKLKNQLRLIPAYDALTDRVFHDDFEMLEVRLRHAIKTSHFSEATDAVGRPVVRSALALLRFMPPVVLVIVKALVPPAFKDVFKKIVKRSRSE